MKRTTKVSLKEPRKAANKKKTSNVADIDEDIQDKDFDECMQVTLETLHKEFANRPESDRLTLKEFEKLVTLDIRSWEYSDTMLSLRSAGSRFFTVFEIFFKTCTNESKKMAGRTILENEPKWQIASPKLISLFRFTFLLLSNLSDYAKNLPKRNPIRGRLNIYLSHVAFEMQGFLKKMSEAAAIPVPSVGDKKPKGRSRSKYSERSIDALSKKSGNSTRDRRDSGPVPNFVKSLKKSFGQFTGRKEVVPKKSKELHEDINTALERYKMPEVPKAVSGPRKLAYMNIPYENLGMKLASAASKEYKINGKNKFFEIKVRPISNDGASVRNMLLEVSFEKANSLKCVDALSSLIVMYQMEFKNELKFTDDACYGISIFAQGRHDKLTAVPNFIDRCCGVLEAFDSRFGDEFNPFYALIEDKEKQKHLEVIRTDWFKNPSSPKNPFIKELINEQDIIYEYFIQSEEMTLPHMFRLYERACSMSKPLPEDEPLDKLKP